jgi:hypothetical protein
MLQWSGDDDHGVELPVDDLYESSFEIEMPARVEECEREGWFKKGSHAWVAEYMLNLSWKIYRHAPTIADIPRQEEWSVQHAFLSRLYHAPDRVRHGTVLDIPRPGRLRSWKECSQSTRNACNLMLQTFFVLSRQTELTLHNHYLLLWHAGGTG